MFLKALVRDGFRCVVSGKYDANSVRDNKELELELEHEPGRAVSATECAHILPESTNANISGSSNAQSDKVYFFPTLDVFLFITWTYTVVSKHGHINYLTVKTHFRQSHVTPLILLPEYGSE